MSVNNNKAWNTKYGPRRVRNEAPTLEEAISAAKDLSDEPEAQAEIAASLMGVPVEAGRGGTGQDGSGAQERADGIVQQPLRRAAGCRG